MSKSLGFNEENVNDELSDNPADDLFNLEREGLYGTALMNGPRYAVVREGVAGRYLDLASNSQTAEGAATVGSWHDACMGKDDVDPAVGVAMFVMEITAVVPLPLEEDADLT